MRYLRYFCYPIHPGAVFLGSIRYPFSVIRYVRSKEIADLVRRCVEKEVNEVRADNALLQARICRLEVALAEKTAGQMSRHPRMGRDLQ